MKNMTVQEFAMQTASNEPVPGGGSISALAGSLAAALTEMVAGLTIGKKKYAEVEEEMKAADMIAKLNANLSANAWGAGADGFPALLWEIDRTGSIESVGATAGIEIVKEGDRLVVVSATGERARLSVYRWRLRYGAR